MSNASAGQFLDGEAAYATSVISEMVPSGNQNTSLPQHTREGRFLKQEEDEQYKVVICQMVSSGNQNNSPMPDAFAEQSLSLEADQATVEVTQMTSLQDENITLPHETFSVKSLIEEDIMYFRTYDDWRNYLQDFEAETMSHFIISAETKDFSKEVTLEEILKENRSPKLRWEFKAANCLWPIPYTGSPYIHLGTQEYHCHQGRDLNLKRKEQRKLDINKDCMKKRRKVIQPTKKQDCPIKFVVKKIFRFSSYKLEKDSIRNRKKVLDTIRDKEFCLKMVTKESLDSLSNPGFSQYLVVMPTGQHQNHHTGVHGAIVQPLDNRVKEFIISQIQQGCTRPKDIQIRVVEFVKESIFEGKIIPELSKKTFCPSRKKISNIKIAVTRCSKIDQENFEHLVQDWRKLGADELLNTDELETEEVHIESAHSVDMSDSDCSFTIDKDKSYNESPAKQTIIEGKKMNIRSTLKQFIDITYDINNLNVLDDLDNVLTACLGKLKKSLYGDCIPLSDFVKEEQQSSGKRKIKKTQSKKRKHP